VGARRVLPLQRLEVSFWLSSLPPPSCCVCQFSSVLRNHRTSRFSAHFEPFTSPLSPQDDRCKIVVYFFFVFVPSKKNLPSPTFPPARFPLFPVFFAVFFCLARLFYWFFPRDLVCFFPSRLSFSFLSCPHPPFIASVLFPFSRGPPIPGFTRNVSPSGDPFFLQRFSMCANTFPVYTLSCLILKSLAGPPTLPPPNCFFPSLPQNFPPLPHPPRPLGLVFKVFPCFLAPSFPPHSPIHPVSPLVFSVFVPGSLALFSFSRTNFASNQNANNLGFPSPFLTSNPSPKRKQQPFFFFDDLKAFFFFSFFPRFLGFWGDQ